MTTGHKHPFAVYINVLAADCACGRLKLLPVLFAVLFLNLNEWQPLHRFLLRFLDLLSGLGLLFGDTPHDFE
jgi:hypothetical protein